MTFAVVPVKQLDQAKGRLAARLADRERRELVVAMLDDVLDALSQTPGLSGVMVVTPDPEIASIAARFGAEHLPEPAGQAQAAEGLPVDNGYTRAVSCAARELERRKERAMLSIPGDVPSVTPHEIELILSLDRAAVVLVPSRDERGTNAALVRPPCALPLRFGEPSFPGHLQRAEQLGLRAEVLRLPGLSLDLDSPDDLDEFMSHPSATRTYRLLSRQVLP